MSEQIWVALIGTIPSVLALVGVVYSIRVSQGNRRVINKVADQTNGMLKHISDAAEAKGVLAGIKQEQDRQPPV